MKTRRWASRALRASACAVLGAALVAACGGGGGDSASPSTGGTTPTPVMQPSDGVTVTLALAHKDLVYDASRRRYYASVDSGVTGLGNTIAVIDPAGGVRYSAPVGSAPDALALSADGQVLYVGLNGSGEVVRLRLPDFQEIDRTRLPVDAHLGQTVAQQIAVSPQDPTVAAVSLARDNSRPAHAGVVLMRNGVLQPGRTADHTGANLLAFDGNGTSVYGFNFETSEFGLREMAVSDNGLVETRVVPATQDFYLLSLDWTPRGLVLGPDLYRPSDFARLGRVGIFQPSVSCRPTPSGDWLVCLNGAGAIGPKLAVVDTRSFSIVSQPTFSGSTDSWGLPNAPRQVVMGPSGQVALRMGVLNDADTAASGLILFTSTLLP